MKAAYSAVAWGWTSHAATRAPMPWVAEVTGVDPTRRYQRQFVRGRIEHAGVRDGVSSTVTCWWTLQSGRLYQAKTITSRRGGWTTTWLTVTDDGDVTTLTEQEAERWLSDRSASTS
jgi:hypothetical protein